MTRIIGDVHGDISQYHRYTHAAKDSIQLGDFSIEQKDWTAEDNLPAHYILGGNHDNYPAMVDSNRDTLDRFGTVYTNAGTIFYVSGAESPDRHLRTEGITWFRCEQLTFSQARECLALWEMNPSDIIVSHDCPESVAGRMHDIDFYINSWPISSSFTQQLLQAMLEIHRPKLWLFGHHHRDEVHVIDETTFICVNTYIDITRPREE